LVVGFPGNETTVTDGRSGFPAGILRDRNLAAVNVVRVNSLRGPILLVSALDIQDIIAVLQKSILCECVNQMKITHSSINGDVTQLLLNKHDWLDTIFISLLLKQGQHMSSPGVSEQVSINLYACLVRDFSDNSV